MIEIKLSIDEKALQEKVVTLIAEELLEEYLNRYGKALIPLENRYLKARLKESVEEFFYKNKETLNKKVEEVTNRYLENSTASNGRIKKAVDILLKANGENSQ